MAADEPKEEQFSYSPTNVVEAIEYVEGLEKILDGLGDLLWEEKDDALEITIKLVKNHMEKTWPKMTRANVRTLMAAIWEPTCIGLWELSKPEEV